jgi:hypothetical protein
MIHLGFSAGITGCSVKWQRHLKHYPAPYSGATGRAISENTALSAYARGLSPSHRRKCTPISTRPSQNAAVLLIDLCTVDIR